MIRRALGFFGIFISLCSCACVSVLYTFPLSHYGVKKLGVLTLTLINPPQYAQDLELSDEVRVYIDQSINESVNTQFEARGYEVVDLTNLYQSTWAKWKLQATVYYETYRVWSFDRESPFFREFIAMGRREGVDALAFCFVWSIDTTWRSTTEGDLIPGAAARYITSGLPTPWIVAHASATVYGVGDYASQYHLLFDTHDDGATYLDLAKVWDVVPTFAWIGEWEPHPDPTMYGYRRRFYEWTEDDGQLRNRAMITAIEDLRL